MTTPFIVLGIVALIPYLLAMLGGYLRYTKLGKLDSNHPRQQYQESTGIVARAWAAQQNAWEALIFFSVAVISAHLFDADASKAAAACWLFLICRILHAFFYLANWAYPRGLVTIVGLGACIYLFCLAL